jgi:hypothetical protein
MGVARSTFYNRPDKSADGATVCADEVDLRRARNFMAIGVLTLSFVIVTYSERQEGPIRDLSVAFDRWLIL